MDAESREAGPRGSEHRHMGSSDRDSMLKRIRKTKLTGAEDDECSTCPFLLPGKADSPHDLSMN